VVSPEPELVIDADRDRCCGSGNCASVLPDVFSQDDDGLVVVRKPRLPAANRPVLLDAAVLCPVQAIAIRSPR
jgi:ferredoxin